MKKKIIKKDETLADLENKPAGVISVKNKLNIIMNTHLQNPFWDCKNCYRFVCIYTLSNDDSGWWLTTCMFSSSVWCLMKRL